jgi:hypothetical protein
LSNTAYPFFLPASGIPSQQLITWSNPGSLTNARGTRETIYNALKINSFPWQDCEIYLQGSYGNNTNTHGNSDVDVVVEYTAAYFYDADQLPSFDRQQFNGALCSAPLTFDEFYSKVLKTLRARFGENFVKPGNKAIKILGNGNRLPADVIPCFSYRKFSHWKSVLDNSYLEGIRFFTPLEEPSQEITNFPRQHRENAKSKNSDERTGGRYKPTVRMFKNARRYLTEKKLLSGSVAPSYFIECLLYNVHDSLFVSDERERFRSILSVLKSHSISNCVSQNELVPLFGTSPAQWDERSARTLINAWDYLWNNWGTL